MSFHLAREVNIVNGNGLVEVDYRGDVTCQDESLSGHYHVGPDDLVIVTISADIGMQHQRASQSQRSNYVFR